MAQLNRYERQTRRLQPRLPGRLLRKQTSKQANKQTSKQANKQTSKQANKCGPLLVLVNPLTACFLIFLYVFLSLSSLLEEGWSLRRRTLRPSFGIPRRIAAEKKPPCGAVIYNHAYGHKIHGGFL
jgi:hypothetical protein